MSEKKIYNACAVILKIQTGGQNTNSALDLL